MTITPRYHPSIKYQSAGFDHINTSHSDSSAMESQIYPVSIGTEPFPSQYYASVMTSPHPQQHLGVWYDAPMRRALSSYPNSAIYDESRSFALSESTEAMPSWGGGCHLKVAPDDVAPRTLSAPPEYFAYPSTSFDPWQVQRKPENIIDLDNFVAGLAGHDGRQQFSTNNNENIVDLRIPVTSGDEQLPSDAPINHVRHSSASSSSDSSNGPVGDNLAYEEFSSTYNTTPDPLDFRSRDSLSLPTYSVGGSSVSPNLPFQLSPPGGVIRGRQGSHGRAASTPHASLPASNARFNPYSVDNRRAKNWSTSSVTTALVPTARQWAPPANTHQQRFMPQPQGQWDQSPYQSPPPPPLSDHGYGYAPIRPHSDHTYTSTHIPMQPYLGAAAQPTSYDSIASPYDHSYHPAPLMSHGLFRMLQSNAEAVHHQPYRHANLSDPPDLFASLQEAQLAPSKEDMNPSDPDLVPHEQDLRFDGDLYTPRWVRGHGNKREGWCGICKPGRWLVLKNSAFWYDKSFSHGVSAATGSQFHEPQGTRRMDGNPDIWEGLCGSCNDWIALVSSKKKGTTWFRHAYKVR